MGDLLNHPGFYISYAAVQAGAVLLLIRFLDRYRREPLGLLAAMAAWGASGAPLIALAGNSAVRALLAPDAQQVFGNAVSAPIVEESAKGLALLAAIGPLRWVAGRAGVAVFEGPTAGIVYGAAVGLGFAFTEDVFYFVDQARTQGLEGGIGVFLDRRDFFGPAVLHHPVFTAAFGAGLGLATWTTSRAGRILYPLAGFLLAVLMHAVNNGFVELVLVLRYGLAATAAWSRGLLADPALADTALTMTKVLRLVDFYYVAAFVGAMWLWTRHQRGVIRGELEEEVASGLASEADRKLLTEPWERSERYWHLARTGQLEQWRHERRLHAALVDLALLKWRLRRSGGEWGRVQRLRREIATLATYEPRAHDVPVAQNPLVGRERELAEVAALFERPEIRVVTLMGPGGTGKTRLSLELAGELRDRFAGGVVFVPLAATDDPGVALSAIAEKLGVAEQPGERTVDTLADALRDKQLLLVLDNLEQVTSVAPALGELLAAARRVRVLATSRNALRLLGEHEVPLPPLDEEGAAELFLQRALAIDPGFSPRGEDRRAISEICRRLDGLPLAIELAAARVRVLPPAAILERLDIGLLSGGARDLPERHQTMRATIDWSFELLDPAEQGLFARFGVFAAGARLDAVEAVCAPGDPAVHERLASLAEKSLVRRTAHGGEPRFSMLQTIREYALERLDERGEGEETRRRQASYLVALAERAEPELTGPGQAGWLDRLAEEQDNVRAALAWSLASGELEHGLRLAGALYRFWSVRGHLAEPRGWLERALPAAGGAGPGVRARALFAAGYTALGQGDLGPARDSFERALELARETGDARLEGAALAQLAWLAAAAAEPEAVTLAERSLDLARGAGDDLTASGALNTLAEAALAVGDAERGIALLEESLALRRALGDRRLVANSLLALGRVRGEAAPLEEALGLARSIGDTWSECVALTRLGRLRLASGDAAACADLLAQGLRLARDRGDRRAIADCLQGLAAASAETGAYRRAARLLGAAESLAASIGTPAGGAGGVRELLQEHLAEAALAAEEAAGRTLELDEAVAIALEAADDGAAPRAAAALAS